MNKTGHTFRLSRRSLLLGAGGMALGLPLLDVMGKTQRTLAEAVPGYTAEGFPKRFIVWFTPNGTIPPNWIPAGGASDFQLSPILEPLAPYRDKLLILDGVDQTGTGGGDAHQSGMQGMLTGQKLNAGPFQGGDGFSAGWANGISVDQRIAEVIGLETPFRSLEFAVQPGRDENNYSRMSLRGPDQPLAPEDSPFNAYERLFAATGVGTTPTDPRRNDRRRRVLDAVHENFKRLVSRVGSADRQKLEQHATYVAEIEERLGKRPPAASDACSAPVLGSELELYDNGQFPTVGRLQIDLMVMAMACDLTRVSGLQWSRSVGQTRYDWVDSTITRGHHDMSHDGDSNETTFRQLTAVNRWYADQFGYLLGRLDAIKEGDGTMLDNTVVLWCNELAKGNSHELQNSYFVVAGGARYFDMGRYLRYDYASGPKHNNLLLSLVNSMGIEDQSFGLPEWCTGPLDGMTG